MVYNSARAKQMAWRQIRRLGGMRRAAIRREGVGDIPVTLAVVDYTPSQIRAGMGATTDKRVVMAALKPDGTDLGIVPDLETDSIILFESDGVTVRDELIMKEPPKRYDPNGIDCLWEIRTSRERG